jgi:transposase InsO family protein
MGNQTSSTVKNLQSDNGGKFESKALASFLAEKGIVAEWALPYHHSQNGVIER